MNILGLTRHKGIAEEEKKTSYNEILLCLKIAGESRFISKRGVIFSKSLSYCE